MVFAPKQQDYDGAGQSWLFAIISVPKGKMCFLWLTVIEFKNWKGHERSDTDAKVDVFIFSTCGKRRPAEGNLYKQNRPDKVQVSEIYIQTRAFGISSHVHPITMRFCCLFLELSNSISRVLFFFVN